MERIAIQADSSAEFQIVCGEICSSKVLCSSRICSTCIEHRNRLNLAFIYESFHLQLQSTLSTAPEFDSRCISHTCPPAGMRLAWGADRATLRVALSCTPGLREFAWMRSCHAMKMHDHSCPASRMRYLSSNRYPAAGSCITPIGDVVRRHCQISLKTTLGGGTRRRFGLFKQWRGCSLLARLTSRKRRGDTAKLRSTRHWEPPTPSACR